MYTVLLIVVVNGRSAVVMIAPPTGDIRRIVASEHVVTSLSGMDGCVVQWTSIQSALYEWMDRYINGWSSIGLPNNGSTLIKLIYRPKTELS